MSGDARCQSTSSRRVGICRLTTHAGGTGGGWKRLCCWRVDGMTRETVLMVRAGSGSVLGGRRGRAGWWAEERHTVVFCRVVSMAQKRVKEGQGGLRSSRSQGASSVIDSDNMARGNRRIRRRHTLKRPLSWSSRSIHCCYTSRPSTTLMIKRSDDRQRQCDHRFDSSLKRLILRCDGLERIQSVEATTGTRDGTHHILDVDICYVLV